MIDFEVMNTALKIFWIKRICQNSESSWKTLAEHFFREHGGLSFLLNCRYDVKLLNLNYVPPFYHTILKYWQENKAIILDDPHKENEIIWNNKSILINKTMRYSKQWHRTGLMYINDLLDENFNFLSYDKFQRVSQLYIPFTTYYGLISAIAPSWRPTIKRTESPLENDNASQEPPLPTNFTTRAINAAIIDYYFQPPTVEPKLLQYGFTKESLKKVYNLPFVTTLETKLQIFQYKIIHDILPTTCSLYRIKLCDSVPFCSVFCIFFYCSTCCNQNNNNNNNNNKIKTNNKTTGADDKIENCCFLIDIDECLTSKPCDENADCVNIDSSFICTCRQGFTGNGTTCNGKYCKVLFLSFL